MDLLNARTSRDTRREAVDPCITPLDFALRMRRVAVAKVALVCSALPESRASWKLRTADFTWLRTAVFRIVRVSFCRARFAADLLLATRNSEFAKRLEFSEGLHTRPSNLRARTNRLLARVSSGFPLRYLCQMSDFPRPLAVGNRKGKGGGGQRPVN